MMAAPPASYFLTASRTAFASACAFFTAARAAVRDDFGDDSAEWLEL